MVKFNAFQLSPYMHAVKKSCMTQRYHFRLPLNTEAVYKCSRNITREIITANIWTNTNKRTAPPTFARHGTIPYHDWVHHIQPTQPRPVQPWRRSNVNVSRPAEERLRDLVRRWWMLFVRWTWFSESVWVTRVDTQVNLDALASRSIKWMRVEQIAMWYL